MDRWEKLFREYADGERRRKRAAEEAEESRRRFEVFAAQVTDRLMEDVAAVARRHAAEFTAITARAVEVSYPSHARVELAHEGPFMTFLRLSLGAASVHLYSHRMRNGMPAIHMVPTEDEHLNRHHLLLSYPGCLVVPSGEDGYELRTIAGSDGGGGEPVTVDEVVYRAFDLMLRGRKSAEG